MLQTQDTALAGRTGGMRFGEFVALMALMMGLTALAVDIMLPALGTIGEALSVERDNDRQLIITYYLSGFALGQIVFGPISDRIGRKGPLIFGLMLFAAGDVAAIFAPSAQTLFWARALQGFGAAAPRVIALAIIRDRHAGREMAQVMSFVMMVFITVPILAPLIGQAVLHFVFWRGLFGVLLAVSLVTLLWTSWRLSDKGKAETRQHVPLITAAGMLVRSRQTVGYAVGFGFFFGILMSYIGSSEQIFTDVYQSGTAFPLIFAGIASVMILASFANSRLVMRHGMRRVSHLALLGLLTACGLMALAGFPERPPLAVFCLFIAAVFFCFGLIGPKFNALAMEPMGKIAGTASSFIGFYTTAAGTLLGWLIGQQFDGTIRPLTIGLTLLASSALLTVLITERFKLARQTPPQPPSLEGRPAAGG